MVFKESFSGIQTSSLIFNNTTLGKVFTNTLKLIAEKFNKRIRQLQQCYRETPALEKKLNTIQCFKLFGKIAGPLPGIEMTDETGEALEESTFCDCLFPKPRREKYPSKGLRLKYF